MKLWCYTRFGADVTPYNVNLNQPLVCNQPVVEDYIPKPETIYVSLL